MPSLNQDSYLKQRVDDQLQWLSQASKTNKRQFLAWRILEILLGTSITILSPLSRSLPWAPITIAVAGGGIAVSGALLALSRSQENWVRYRSLAEGLKPSSSPVHRPTAEARMPSHSSCWSPRI
jgi:hypothetical protein